MFWGFPQLKNPRNPAARLPWGSQSRDAVPLWPPKSQGTAEYFATAAVAGYNTWAPKAMGGSILISGWLEDLGVSEKNASNYPKDAWLIDSKLGWTRTQSETINTRLVGGFNPPWKILVSWADDSQYMENKKCSKPPTSSCRDPEIKPSRSKGSKAKDPKDPPLRACCCRTKPGRSWTRRLTGGSEVPPKWAFLGSHCI